VIRLLLLLALVLQSLLPAACADLSLGCGDVGGPSDEALHLLQRRGSRLVAHDQDLLLKASASERPQEAAATVQRGPTMMSSFRKLFLSCDHRLGSAERCSDAIVGNSLDVFDVLQRSRTANEVFSLDELQAFRTRFKLSLTEESKKIYGHRFIWDRFRAWKHLVTTCFDSMRPGISEALVRYVNENNATLGWNATYDSSMMDISVEDFQKILGLESSEEEKAELNQSRYTKLEDLVETDALESDAVHRREGPSGPYDARQHWPQCQDVMRHVRFQTCPNCWSHSTALITESRICIKLGGKFKGRDAWLSQSYVAACRTDGRSYCQGGAGTLGFKTVTQWGLPTGASDSKGNADPEAKTCYPQIPSGLAKVNCPASCGRSEYPRDLQHDTFFASYSNPRAFHPQSDIVHLLVKRELMEEGPVMMGFRAYQDLQAYRSGIYRPAKTKKNRSLGGHAVTVMGFGPGYWLCTNSWGDKWGMEGTFNIAVEAVDIGFYLPGKLEYGKYGRFPLPVP